jgi:acyl-CoA dehydrogenase
MEFATLHQPTAEQAALRDAVTRLCETFDDAYWLRKDRDGTFPHDFHRAVAEGGWLGIAAPEQYGGSGLGLQEVATLLQTIAECGGGMNGGTSVKINIFGLFPLIQFGTEDQKQRLIPPVIRGEEKLCFAITEPGAGLDTRHLRTVARRDGGDYVLDGAKTWISTAQVADRMLILARTTPIDAVRSPSEGLTLFLTPLDRRHVEVREIARMGRSAVDANQLFIEGMRVPEQDRIGEEGKGLSYVFHSMNPERVVVAAEAIGIGRAALRRAARYASERVVFDRPIGQNQGVQHPLARCWMELEAANLMTFRAAELFDRGEPCGLAANSAKYLGAEAGYRACETAIMTHGGMGYAREFHVERYLRDILVARIAPITPQLILSYVAERALGLPKSY